MVIEKIIDIFGIDKTLSMNQKYWINVNQFVLRQLFDLLNNEIFNEKLRSTIPLIVGNSNPNARAAYNFSAEYNNLTQKFILSNFKKPNITFWKNGINTFPLLFIASCLCHEMIHMHCIENLNQLNMYKPPAKFNAHDAMFQDFSDEITNDGLQIFSKIELKMNDAIFQIIDNAQSSVDDSILLSLNETDNNFSLDNKLEKHKTKTKQLNSKIVYVSLA